MVNLGLGFRVFRVWDAGNSGNSHIINLGHRYVLCICGCTDPLVNDNSRNFPVGAQGRCLDVWF